jgi:hypothetical protein
VTKQSAAKKSTAGKVATSKANGRAPTKQPVAKKAPANSGNPVASRRPAPAGASGKPAARKSGGPSSASAGKTRGTSSRETPVKHISPEEAVAHIQALLDAKHERDRQGPQWPGAAQQAHPDGSTQAGPEVPAAPTAPDNLAHERGSKRDKG